MKKLLFIIAIFQLQIIYAQQTTVKMGTIEAIVRPDNSFVNYDDSSSKTVSVPKLVNDKIKTVYKKYKDDLFSAGYKPLVFKVRYSANIDIYVLKVHAAPGVIYYKFLAFDHSLQKITVHPVSIYGTWMENNEEGFKTSYRLLSGPLIYFTDKQIVIKERMHNGTAHNAEDDHYYVLNDNLQFKQVLCIESKTIDAMSDCLIRRTLQHDTLICTTTCNGAKSAIIGKVVLNFKPHVHIKNKQAMNDKYSDVLVSESGVNDEKFLQQGSSFAY
jgi:hypothetical protein